MDGVGCESCHGAGSEYQGEAVMKDRAAARKAGLRPVTQATCAACHAKAHGQPFDFKTAKAKIAHPLEPEPLLEAVGRRTALASSNGFSDLEEQYGTARSKGARVLLEELEVRYKNPINLAFTPDGREVWVACESGDSVIVVDAAPFELVVADTVCVPMVNDMASPGMPFPVASDVRVAVSVTTSEYWPVVSPE
jgi:hypothetical protein